MGRLVKLSIAALVGPLLVLSLLSVPAHAASRVTVTNEQGTATADPTFATTLRLKGNGFQSVKSGYGGIYVMFGTVTGGWQPSRGGVSGTNYLFVPDSQDKDNQGFQKFVAFPGSDTAASANGGTVSANGSWSASIVVPGATFQTVDSSGKARTVDCRKVTCGVITIGAHGVKNARNETFTPVRFASLGSSPSASATARPSAAPTTTGVSPTAAPSGAPAAASAAPTLTVDRATAVAGHVLSFTAQGFQPGEQVNVTFDDGMAGVGPIPVGTSGEVAGVIQLPAQSTAGTHVLRMTGAASRASASANFAVAPGEVIANVEPAASDARAPYVFLGLAIAAVLGALAFTLVRRFRGRRRAGASDAV